MTLTRISITIPKELVDAADRRASALQRSRSWLLVEALRRHLGFDARQPEASSGAVHETEAANRPVAAAPEVAAARRRRLAAELRHSPADRLRAAEELILLAHEVRRPPPRMQVIGFNTYEDYYAWKVKRLIGG